MEVNKGNRLTKDDFLLKTEEEVKEYLTKPYISENGFKVKRNFKSSGWILMIH